MMKRVMLAVMVIGLCACRTETVSEQEPVSAGSIQETEQAEPEETVTTEETLVPEDTVPEEEEEMKLIIGETEVPVTWEDNASVEALKELCPLRISMSMYGGFEQVGSIGQSIVRDDRQTETAAGDIVLYSGNQIVIFYGTNSWAYTRLGHVDLSRSEMTDLLGNGDVEISLE